MAKLHSDLEALVGSTIHDRYRVDALIGAGGMGAVFKAHHTGLDRGVALKVLHPEIGRDESVSKRFDREAHSASRLDHPNCVRVTDFGTTANGTKYLVMELLEGGDLDGRLGRRWAPEHAVATITQVLHGLEHAHHVGVVHRDLKPENIFVTADFRGHELVKIVDFGIAKLIDERGSEKLTRQGIVFGTPRYMSPEQAAGGKIDERSDLYAAGLILYELLAGRSPFETDDAAQLLRMQIMAPPPPLPDDVAPGLVAIVDKLLEKSKSDRYTSAREVIDALEGLGLSASGGAGSALAGSAASASVAVTTALPVATAALPVATSGHATGPAIGELAAAASSGSSWQPAPPAASGVPHLAASGVTLHASAADLHAAASLSAAVGPIAAASAPAHATGPLPALETGPHASLAHGSGPVVQVQESTPARRWWPVALASVGLLALVGIGAVMMSIGDGPRTNNSGPIDDPAPLASGSPSVSAEPAEAAPPVPAEIASISAQPHQEPASGASPAPGPSRPSKSDPPKPSKPEASGGASPDRKEGTAGAEDSSVAPSGVDPRDAEREREAAAKQQQVEAEKAAAKQQAKEQKVQDEREAAGRDQDKPDHDEDKGKGKGKGKGAADNDRGKPAR
jgi:eukaryotic-like serine/threonine-protein kinase